MQRLSLAYVFFLAAALVCYSPVLSKGYAVSDDYFQLAQVIRVPDWFYEQMVCSSLQGRPVDGLILGLALRCTHGIGDFLYMRMLGIFAEAAVALCAFVLLRQSGWGRLQSAGLALVFITVPAFQVLSAWSVAALHIPAALGAFGAVQLVKNCHDWRSLRNRLKFCVACISLFLGLALYQPIAMFFWLFVAITLFDGGMWTIEKTKRLVNYFAVFGAAAACEMVFFEAAKILLGTNGVLPQRSHLTADILGKLNWFIHGPLVEALNLNRLQPSPQIALIVGLFVIAGLLLYFQGRLLSRCLQLLLSLALLFLSYLPNLAIAEDFGTYRTQAALTPLLLFYLGLATMATVRLVVRRSYATVCSAIFLGFAVVNLTAAHYNVQNFFVLPQTLELQLVRTQLDGAFGPYLQSKPLHLSRPETLAPFIRYDEFGLPSLAQPWVPEPVVFLLKRDRARASEVASAKENPLR